MDTKQANRTCPIEIKSQIRTDDPKEIFNKFLKKKKLRSTGQRDIIIDAFLNTDEHVSAQELFDLVRKTNPEIGYATVSRTLNLMVEAGISWVVDFNDGVRRFDQKYGGVRHGHLVCTECGHCIEFTPSEELQKLKKELADRNGFELNYFRTDIFGLCKNCRK